MKGWHWLAAGLGAGTLLWAGISSPKTVVNLSELSFSTEKDVLSPEAPLARAESGPFVGSDSWWDGDLLWVNSPLRSSLSFYVKTRTALEMEIQARFSNQTRQPVLFSLNETPWLSCPITHEWQTFRARLPQQALRSGRNRLTMKMEVGNSLQLRKFRVYSEHIGRGMPELKPAALSLPWESSLAVALPPGRGTRLRCQSLQVDVQPGAPAVQLATLRLSLRGPGQQWQEDVKVAGGPFQITLPTSASNWSKLQLRAVNPGSPLPGQLGLKLLQPQLELQAPVRPVPTIARGNLQQGKPNVVIYLIDTLRPDHLGCYGRSPSPSPALDRLAQDSVLFLDASAQSGWTKPATASIFSSQWPWRHRVQDFADQLGADVPWLPQILRAHGYQTGAVVTNRLAGSEFGYQRGYDSFRQLAKDTSEHAHLEAVNWLEKRNADRPFLLYVHTIDPHAPYMHSPAYRGRSRAQAEEIDQEPRLLAEEATLLRFRGRKLDELKPRVDQLIADYDREIANNDRSFGQLVEWLKAHNVYDNTLIIVVSDHGEEFLEHGYVGHLNSLYQELLHIPMLIKFPAQAGAATRVAETWQQIDLAPTVLKACGISPPSTFQGLAYQPGDVAPPARACLFSVQAGRALAGHRPEDKRAIFCSAHGIRQGHWMYQRVLACGPGQREPEELYDLERDPRQQSNLAELDPGRALGLAAPLEALFRYDSQARPQSPESNRKLMELLESLQYVR